MVPDLLNFRLEIVNKLVNAELLEKELALRTKYQNMFIPLLEVSSVEFPNDLNDNIASFTVTNNSIIDDILDKKSQIVLDFLSAYPSDRRSRLDLVSPGRLSGSDIPFLLEQSQKIISSAKQIPRIKQMREVRLERGTLENRIKTLIHDSGILPGSLSRSAVTSLEQMMLNVRTMYSCHAALEQTVKNVQDLKELGKRSKIYEKDMSSTLRLAQVRDSLLQLKETQSRCIKEIAVTKDGIQVVKLLHCPVPPSRSLAVPFEMVVDPIETFLKTFMIRFFEKDQMMPQIQNVDTKVHLAFHIRTHLEKALNFALDDDTREILHKIWNHTSSPDGSVDKIEVSD